MTMRVRGLVVCLLSVGLFGCSGSDKPGPSQLERCVTVCEALQAADCDDPAPPGDCSVLCGDVTRSVEASGCTSAYNAALVCAERHDTCEIDQCTAENSAWLTCVQCAPSDEDAGSEDAGSDDDAGACN